jgi:hypothetical protein
MFDRNVQRVFLFKRIWGEQNDENTDRNFLSHYDAYFLLDGIFYKIPVLVESTLYLFVYRYNFIHDGRVMASKSTCT